MTGRHLPIKSAIAALLLLSKPVWADAFSEHHLDVDFNITQAPISADISPHPGKEIIAIGRSSAKAQQVAVLALVDGTLTQVDRFAIGEQYFAYDIGNDPQGKQTLYFLAKDHVGRYQYPQGPSEPRLLSYLEVSSVFQIQRSNFMRRMPFIFDFNGDESADVMLPNFNELQVWFSQQDKAHKLSKLAITGQNVLTRDGLSVTPAQTFTLDINNDERMDIVHLTPGQLHIYTAAKRHFDHQAVAIREDIHAIDWWDQLDDDGRSLDQSDLNYRKLERFEDVNGDAIVDMVVRYTQSSGVLDRKNDYEIFYGKNTADGELRYGAQADTTVRAEGTLTGLELQDIDGDGRKEVMVSSFELGVSQVVSALLASSIDQDVLLYRQNAQGQYPEQPSMDYETEMGFSISKGRASEPLVKLADISGDGILDLLLSEDSDELIYRLGNKDGGFSRKSSQDIALPQSAAQISHADINGDNKADLIAYYGKLDSAKLHKRLTLLVAK